jgi:hypothetical protein
MCTLGVQAGPILRIGTERTALLLAIGQHAGSQEAKHSEVVRLAAFIARVTGKDELALELAAKNPDPVEGELMRAAVLGGGRRWRGRRRPR